MTTVLGRYEIIEELGRGAMGVVYKARDPVLNRIVAIKTMSAEMADDEELRNRLTREANAAAKLKHPNIITVHDYGEDRGVPFIALEFLEGLDLKQIIRNRVDLYPKEQLGILKQVALGLAHAHAAGVIHRDVKPGNIRILKDGTVKIMDFGIARVASSQMTRAGTVLGSIDYMSPEQVEGQRVDERADQFGFGVVAYELLTGKLPFKSETVPATLNKILQASPEPIDDSIVGAFPNMNGVISKCLQKSPTARFTSFSEIARSLEDIMASMAPAPLARGRLDAPDAPAPDDETVMIDGSDAPETGTDWQAGDQTVSSARLWVARDRFQVISARIEKVEQQKPKRPVRLGTSQKAAEAPASRSATAKPAPPPVDRDIGRVKGRTSVATQERRSNALIGVGLAVLVALAVAIGWLAARDPRPQTESSTNQVEEFARARFEASARKQNGGDLRGAVEELERVLEVAPAHSEAQQRLDAVTQELDEEFDRSLARANELVAAGQHERAIEHVERALSLKPGDETARGLQQQAGAALNRERSAAQSAEQINELLSQARTDLSAGRTSAALSALQSAAQIDASHAEVRSLLAEVERRRAQASTASRAYDAGDSAFDRGDFEEAVRQLRRALELDPGNARARERLTEAERELQRPRYGIVTINALPFGDAYIDGENVGQTPVRLEQVAAGRHTIRIDKPGYQSFTREIDVVEGETTNVVAQLQRAP